jgi:glutamate/tyrosine decarboxylase-like PLP-dependent enzyme
VTIARATGLGTGALHAAAADSALRLDVADLRRRFAEDREAGCLPVMVVGTAGTTSAGVIDPLPELADFCREQKVWFHVDAAWGGAAALSSRLKPFLSGIEHADSITWDAHKWLSVSMGAGMFFCRHREALDRAFAVDASYVPRPAGGTSDQYMTTMQWSRRFIGLKVFMALAELGRDGLARLIEHQAHMGVELRARLTTAGWEPVNQTPLPLVCFTHEAIRTGTASTQTVIAGLNRRRKVWISDVILPGHGRVLRACITSFRTGPEDLDLLVSELNQALAGG